MIEERLQHLYRDLREHIAKVDESALPHKGLLSGTYGAAMFFYYFGLHTGNEVAQQDAEELLVQRLNHIDVMMQNPYFCNGLAGVAWLMRVFEEQEIMEISGVMEELLQVIDESIMDGFELTLRVGNFDFLHGSVGILNYLLRKPGHTEYADRFVSALDRFKIETGSGCLAWKSNVMGADGMESVFNLGFAHGMPSVLTMLAHLIEKNALTDPALASELLEGGIRFLLSERQYDKTSSYSNQSSFDATFVNSRLAWCYGDLGVCLALLHAGKALNRKEWIQVGEEVALKTLSRRTLPLTGFKDTGLCHGTAGVALLYRRFWELTGNPEFREAENYWFHETLAMGDYTDGLGGFKTWTKDEMLKDCNVLDGAAGIGLALLSTVAEIPDTWENSLLLR